MIEIAYKPVDRLAGVNSQLMDVLLIALSNDPAARPTAATFRDLLANVPALGHPSAEARPEVGDELVPPSCRPAAATAAPPAPGPEPPAEAPPSERRRRLGVLGLVAALVTVIASTTAWLVSEPASSGVPAATPPSAASGVPTSRAASSAPPALVRLRRARHQAAVTSPVPIRPRSRSSRLDPPRSAEPFETIRIRGTYHGGPSTFLRVQRWENDGWRTFPLPTKTDESGHFTAHVELGQPGRYRLRLVDVDSGMSSKPFELVIKG